MQRNAWLLCQNLKPKLIFDVKGNRNCQSSALLRVVLLFQLSEKVMDFFAMCNFFQTDFKLLTGQFKNFFSSGVKNIGVLSSCLKRDFICE